MILSISNFNYNTYTQLTQSVKVRFGLQPLDSVSLKPKRDLTIEEEWKINELKTQLPAKSIIELENLKTNGILIDNRSNDGSTTLDNLYKIYKTGRAEGLNGKVILAETVQHLNNPYLISQKSDNSIKNYLEALFSPKHPIYEKDTSSTCTASCIEFDLANQEPAEFTRFVEGLTSSEMKVDKTIKLENLADKTLDAIWLLNTFDVDSEEKDFDKVKLTFRPDDMALLKVSLNSNSKTKQRNSIDTILQATFMNIGSQGSYNSLTDRRAGKFNVTERGLIEFEKTFVESVVRDKNIISVNYQKIENGKIAGYEADFGTIKKQLLDALALKENVILGIVQPDKKGKLKGHEIVLVGAKTHSNGKTDFLCFNSDMDKTSPVTYSEDYLLPKIHHAGLPKSVVEKTMTFKDGWVLGLENYKSMKKVNFNRS